MSPGPGGGASPGGPAGGLAESGGLGEDGSAAGTGAADDPDGENGAGEVDEAGEADDGGAAGGLGEGPDGPGEAGGGSGEGKAGVADGEGTGGNGEAVADSAAPEAVAGGAAPVGVAPGGGSVIGALSVRPEQPTHAYVFHAGGEVLETVILKGGEALAEPASPTQAGKRFDGWFEDEACTLAFDGFGEPAAQLDGGTTDLWAKFSDVHYFTYHDEHGKVIETEVVELGQEYTFRAQWPAFELDSDTARNDGWRDQHGVAYADLDAHPDGQTVTVTGDLDLAPVPQEGFYVHFHGQGGSATVSQFVHEGGKVAKPADPTRQGYSFAGWYDAAEGGSAFDFSKEYTTLPSGSVEVYAHWDPATADYTLVYMVEDPDHDEGAPTYSFYSSVKKQGATGERIVLTDDDKNYGKVQVSGIDQYFVNDERTGEMPVIKADGSTELIVYCDLWYYNLSYGSKTVKVRCGQALKSAMEELELADSYSYPKGYHLYLYGNSSLSGNYAEIVNYLDEDEAGAFYAQYRLRNNVSFTQYSRSYDALPAGGVWPYGTIFYIKPVSYAGNYKYVQYWMLETIDSTDSEPQYKAHERVLMHTRDNLQLQPPSDYPPFKFQRVEGSIDAGNGQYKFDSDGQGGFKPVYLYFSRAKYKLVFEENGGASVADVDGIFYEKPIADLEPADAYRVGKTTKVDHGKRYIFTGWYLDSATTPEGRFDFAGATMRAADLTLYAGWEEESHTVTYDAMGGTMQDDASLTVPYGTRLEEPAAPTRHGYRFVDWHLVDPADPDGMGTPFVFGSPVTDDMVLRAHWTSDLSHTIIYEPGEGSGSVPSIGSYRSGATGRAQSGDALTPPAGKHFAYWLSADGTVYYPGQLVPVEAADVVLTAVYAPADLTGLTYDLNYRGHGIASPCGYETSPGPDCLPNNSTIELRRPTAAETPDGWEFVGWFLDAACSGEPVARVLVDAQTGSLAAQSADGLAIQATASQPANVVYAKWAKKEVPSSDDPGPEPKPGGDPDPEPGPNPEPGGDSKPDPSTEDRQSESVPEGQRPSPESEGQQPAPEDPKPASAAAPQSGPQAASTQPVTPTPAASQAKAANQAKAATPATGDSLIVIAGAIGIMALLALCTAALARRQWKR